MENKISLVKLEDAMLVTEQNDQDFALNAQAPEVLDSARNRSVAVSIDGQNLSKSSLK